MALVVKDRVKVYSSTTGTGTLSLGSAFAGFQTFNNALGDGDTTYYGIFESSTGNWEVGLGTYTSSGNTLSRDTILESSNAGAAVNLTADTEVFITYPAEKSVYFDANGDVNLTRDPQSALQAATKQYVDTIAAAGLHYHAPVRVEHPSNLTATYDNGTSGVGATLTNSGTQAVLVLDNVTMVVSDRVLIANQTNQAHNGVYTVTNIGSASTNWVLTRATDADSYGPSDPDALGEGDAFFIKEGDTNAGHLDVMTTSGTITFGTTNIVFSEVAETTVYSAGNGLSLSGTEFNVGAGTGISVDATAVSTVQDIATSATPQFDGLTTTGNITFGDNDKAIFGAGSDLQIYHESSSGSSYVKEGGTGNLYIQGSNLILEDSNGGNFLYGTQGGDVRVYHNGSVKLATTSTGIDVTGTVTADGLTVDGNVTVQKNNPVVTIADTGTSNQQSFIRQLSGTLYFDGQSGATADGSFLFRGYDGSTNKMLISYNGDISFYEDTGTNVNFFWDASTMALGIGTGTTTPTNPLTIQQTSVHWPYIALTNSSGVTKSQFGYQVNDDLLDIVANSGGIKFRTNNTETMRLSSSGVLSVGNTAPKTWNSNSSGVIQFGGVGALENYNTTDDPVIWSANQYRASDGNFKYIETNEASRISQYAGEFYFQTAPSGTADTNATFTTRLKINNGGNVGIGTDSPVVPLNVEAAGVSSAGENTHVRINDTTNMAAGVGGVIQLSGEADSGGTTQYTFATIKGIKENGTSGNYNGALTFSTRTNGVSPAAERMRIDSSGKVGIGTTSPTRQLDVESSQVVVATLVSTNASNYSLLRFLDGSNTNEASAAGIGSVGEELSFQTSGTARMRIDSSGNVGIGTSSPSSTLDVNGNASVSGTFTIDNSTQTSFNVEYADDDATVGPLLRTYRNSASPAAEDLLGGIDFKGNDSAGNEFFYSRIMGVIVDPTDTSEDGAVEINVAKAGTAAWNATGLVARFDPDGMELRGDLRFEGATADNFETTVTVTDPTADRTITLPDASGTVWTSGNDGSGSGLDADTVDSIQASSFLRSDASDTYTSGTLTFGSGTGLNMSANDAYASMRVIRNSNTTSTGLFLGYGNGGSGNTLLYGGGSTSATATVTNTGITTYGDFTIDKNTPRIDFQADQSGSNVGGRIELNENGNLWVNAQGGKTLWLNWYAPNTSTSYADLNVGDGNQGSYIFNVDGSARAVNVSGTLGVSGILTTSGSSSGGVRIGANSSGYPLLTTVNGVEFVIRDTDQIRFSDSTSWDYNAWGGIRYESASNLMTIGGPSSSKFTNNTSPPDITINFDGLSGVDGLTYEGNPIWHGGNTGTVLTNRGTGTDITSNNWNDYIDGTEASWVRVINMSGSNRPPNYTYGTALNFSYSSSGKFQLYASHTGSSGDGLYFRTGWNTDYKGWAKIYDSVAHPALSYVDVATGNYGTIKVDDDRGVSWAGYAIGDDWVFMGRADDCGIYNDTDNEWAFYTYRNAGVALYYNGVSKFETTSGGVAVTGAITATGDITAYYSDERLKNFEGKIDGALDKVSQLSGYYFRENDKAKELGFDNDALQVGVSAQEVEAVMPEVIKPAPVDPEYKTVQYEKLVPLLIEAIKELKEEVRQLKEDKA